MSDSVWRSFLSTGEGDDSPAAAPLALVRTAREDAKAAKEEAESKAEQVQLMTAMLQAAEEELKLRSNQLEITNAMLRATEAELMRKDEQLEITTQMLRKAEEEIKLGEQERRALRREMAAMRDSLPRGSKAPVTSSTTRPLGEVVAGEEEELTLVLHDERGEATTHGHGTATSSINGTSGLGGGLGGVVDEETAQLGRDAAAASQLAGDIEARLAASLASMGEEQLRLSASTPTELPEQRTEKITTRVLLSEHTDPRGAMKPKSEIRDARKTVDRIKSRKENPSLPPTHTTMRVEDQFAEEELEVKDAGAGADAMGEESYRRVAYAWKS